MNAAVRLIEDSLFFRHHDDGVTDIVRNCLIGDADAVAVLSYQHLHWQCCHSCIAVVSASAVASAVMLVVCSES